MADEIPILSYNLYPLYFSVPLYRLSATSATHRLKPLLTLVKSGGRYPDFICHPSAAFATQTCNFVRDN